MAMTNAEWCIKQGYKFNDINVLYTKDVGVYAISIKKNGAYTCLGTIKKFCAIYAFMEWLDMEHKEPILDDAEKRYLKGVIRPFRGRAVFVKKIYHTGYTVDYEQIIIRVKSIATLIADIPLPFFKKGEMYKGMKLNREYTLEELGL